MKNFFFFLIICVVIMAPMKILADQELDMLIHEMNYEETLGKLLKKSDNGSHGKRLDGKLHVRSGFWKPLNYIKGGWKKSEDGKLYLSISLKNCQMDFHNKALPWWQIYQEQLFYATQFPIVFDPITREISFNYLRYGRLTTIIEMGKNYVVTSHTEITRNARYRVVVENDCILFKKINDTVKVKEIRKRRETHFGKFVFPIKAENQHYLALVETE